MLAIVDAFTREGLTLEIDLPDFARSRTGQGRNSDASLLIVSRLADESKLNLGDGGSTRDRK